MLSSKMFHGGVLNYPTYDRELCALVQAIKKWKHYLMGKETIIHTYQQPLQYLRAWRSFNKPKISDSANKNKWMGF